MTFPSAPAWALATCNDDVLLEATDPETEIAYIDISAVDRERGITSVQSLPFGDAPSRARRRVQTGDVIVSTVRTYLRAVARVDDEHNGCIVSTGFAVLRPRRDTDPRFLGYAVLDPGFVDQVVAWSVGVSYPAITSTQLMRLPLPAPDAGQQSAVAEFLDRQTSAVGQSIARLDAVVSRGDDAYLTAARELIVSADAPWAPIKLVARPGTGHTPSRSVAEYWDPEACTIPWFGLADVWQIRGDARDVVFETAEKISSVGLANSAAVLHPAGTVIFSRTASVGFVGQMGVDMAVTQDFMTWTCGPRLLPDYLMHALRATRPEILQLVQGSTHKTIYMPDLMGLKIPLPDVGRQREIVARLDRALAAGRRLKPARERVRAALLEYRDSLVHEAVTGKLDVTRVNDRQMAERRQAIAEGRLDEVMA